MNHDQTEFHDVFHAERLVKELYLENGSIFVDQEVFRACWDRISRWVDISILVGYLMKYGVATNPGELLEHVEASLYEAGYSSIKSYFENM